jgi:tetratricopeptide (TPR) repeat protein
LQNQRGNPRAALELADKALARNPNFVPAILLRANSYMLLQNNAEAEAVLKNLVVLQPKNAVAFERLAAVEAGQKRFAAAEGHLERALATQADYVAALTNLIALYAQQHRDSEVIARIQKQTERAPKQAGFHELLGNVYLSRREVSLATQAFQAALNLNPNSTVAQLQLARTYQMQGKAADSIMIAQKVVKEHPDFLAAYILLGTLEQESGSTAEAGRVYEEALRRNPDYAPALNNLAWLYCEHGGNLDMALSMAQKAKEQYPHDATIADTLAWIQYRKGLYAVASKSLEGIARQFPQNATYQYHFGMSLYRDGKVDDARLALHRALELKLPEPAVQEAKGALALIG